MIKAASNDEDFEKAEKIGLEDEGDSNGTFFWEDREAEWAFAGIRKILECADSENRPSYGTEISYSEFEVEYKESLLKLVNGESVHVK